MAYQKYVLAKTGSMVDDIYLFTEFKENWQYFFNESTMTPDSPGDVDKVLNVKQHTRRSGPGAPERTVASHSRYYVRNPKTKGAARPGNPYIITEPAALGSGYRERRQFAILGDDMDVQAYCKAKAKMLIHVTDFRGWTSIIPAAAGGGTALLQPAVTGSNP
jgi:hypothetical protein